MSSETTISREEKEALLNARMEQIRKKNSELQKRYDEVQKDKQNAEAVSDTFQESRRGAPPRETITRPKPIRQHERQQQRTLTSYPKRSEAQRSSEQPAKIDKPRSQRLKEDDGPPPDPSYRFLADKSREREEETKEQEQHDRNQGSRRHPGNYGGRDFDNVKVSIEKRRSYEKTSPRHPPRNKMEMTLCMTGRERREYENWRSERNRIEQERMNRQRTSSGEWRREWDKEKDHEKDAQNKDTALQWSSRGRGEGSKSRGRAPQNEFHSSRGGGGERSGQQNWRSQDTDSRYDRNSLEMTDDDKPSRKVEVNGGESLNISFSNDITHKRDKQRSFSRDSISSQSEDEWRRGEWHQQSANYFHSDKSESDVISSRRSVTLLDEGADANAEKQSLKVVVNLDSVKRECGKEEKGQKLENDGGWEDDGGGSWEDCTTSGNESLVLSEHSQEEFSDCHLEGYADVGTAAEINRKDESESNLEANSFKTSRETTPIVEQSKDHSEIAEAPIEVDKQELLDTAQVVDDTTNDLPIVEVKPWNDVGGDSDADHATTEEVAMASPEVKTESTDDQHDIATKRNDPSFVPQSQTKDAVTVFNYSNTEDTETKEEEDLARAPTPKNHE